ncbi:MULTISPECIES: DUF4153 domain-containing protein [Nitrospirillum]|uniref:Uncharacterized protein DUF4153 n=1 Tax=Nitrospirillum amazonense TaxID=28077 RepID=A0A560G586_9PROT|nr:DUF4153 domain-containing protein [Nitrospirillum amazonense]MEC4592855.1 DUF4153 domain-containing protein [Nitrospirillum amazonense]TWB29056.1 uncharacterized protein DUF4153 [Nitrospirillum amazonense]
MDRTETTSPQAAGRLSGVFLTRLVVALIQAVGLYLLAEAAAKPLGWPATAPALFTPLLTVFMLIPPLILMGAGQISRRPLTAWAMAATLIIAGLAYHAAISRSPVGDGSPLWHNFALWLRLAGGLFIAHTLVVDAVIERRWRPSYPRHFDTAWKQGVQAALTVVFVAVFWGVLYLGAGLFNLLKVTFFERLIQHDWFAIPATTLAIAGAVHITDVQPALIRGARALALTLFSWLLPLLAVIVVGFLGSLPFLSLQPLWRTHFAASLLLTAAAALIFLINCCYQDGAAERTTIAAKRWAGTVGALALLPLVALAAWALGLRVEQYGWSVQRVNAAAITIGLAAYTIGYVIAVIRAPNPLSPTWLRRLEDTNHLTAHLVLILLLALLTPVADPARLMVASQMAQLRAGTLSPDKIDLVALRFDGARWGQDAVTSLREATDSHWTKEQTEALHANATMVLSKENRYLAATASRRPQTAADQVRKLKVYPAGRALPAGLVEVLKDNNRLHDSSSCADTDDESCDAFVITLQPGQPEAVILQENAYSTVLYQQNETGVWSLAGYLSVPICPAVRDALEKGQVTAAPHPWPDLIVGGVRLNIMLPTVNCPTPGP